MKQSFLRNVQPLIANMRINPFAFGYGGESYLKFEFGKNHSFDGKVLHRYLQTHQNLYYNRTPAYYATAVGECMRLIREIPEDFYHVRHSNLPTGVQRYLMFTFVEYLMATAAKLLDLCFTSPALMNRFYSPLKEYLGTLSTLLIGLVFDDFLQLKELPESEWVGSLEVALETLEIQQVRSYVEMDHKMIIFIGYLLLYDVIRTYDLIVSPLLGGVLIAPLFVSLEQRLHSSEAGSAKQFGFLKYSQYDKGRVSGFGQTISMNRQLKALPANGYLVSKVLVIDDSIGTGRTIREIQAQLEKCFDTVDTGAIEYYWDMKLYGPKPERWFRTDEISYVSPLNARHFTLLEQYIEGIQTPSPWNASSQDRQGFFPESVTRLINYRDLIDQQDLPSERKAALIRIYQRFKLIRRYFFMGLLERCGLDAN